MLSSSALLAVLAGLGVGFSLIIAIGAQNLFVLRQGMRREHILVVIAICALSDAVLIVVGVSGVGAALQHVPWLVVAVRWAGAIFLVTYGVLAARRALSGEGALVAEADAPSSASEATTETAADADADAGASSFSSAHPATVATTTTTRAAASVTRVAGASAAGVALTALALTWLNPHVYLDTLFLLGSVANSYGDARWWFAVGAVTASIVWFSALGLGARHLGRVLRSPRAWRILDGAIAAVMVVLGVLLVLPH